jgi:hypothetical protein
MCSTQPTFNHITDYKDAMTVHHCVKYTYENWWLCSGNVISFLTTFTLVNNENVICTSDASLIGSWRSLFMTWVLFCLVTNYTNKLFKIMKQKHILLIWRIWWAPNNASRWQMGFNLVFKGLSGWKFIVLWAFLSFFGGKSFRVRNVLKSQRIHFTENLLY